MTNVIGIDHICISCKNIIEDSKIFEKFGYQISFFEKEIKIGNEKKQFVKTEKKFHDLVFLKSQYSIPIELINHNDFTQNENHVYNLILGITKFDESNSDSVKRDPICELLEKEFGNEFFKKKNDKLSFVFYGQKSKKFDQATSIIIKSSDIEKSSEFWCTLFGFKVIKTSVNNKLIYNILEFTAPIKNWSVKLVLIKEKIEKRETYLNDFGCTCVSFIVTKIEDFLKKFNDLGFFNNSKPYNVIIGGKKMRLVFLRGFDDEIIELIEFKKNE